MPDPTRGLALSAYDAKLVVAALCRYARTSDVHDAHRDRCERLAGALAGECSVTLTASPGDGVAGGRAAGAGRGADARTEGESATAGAGGGADAGTEGESATAGAGRGADAGAEGGDARAGAGRTDPEPEGGDPTTGAARARATAAEATATAPEVASDPGWVASDRTATPADADGGGPDPAEVASDAGGEAAFRWGPDRPDG